VHVQVGDRPGDQCEHPDAADRGALDPAIRPPPHRCAPSTSSPIIAGMYVSVVSPRRHHPPSGSGVAHVSPIRSALPPCRPFAAPAVSSGLPRSRALLTPCRHRYHPARYMVGPPQGHPRSVRGRRNWRSTGQLAYPWRVAAFCRPCADQAVAGSCPAGQSKATRYQQGCRACRWTRGPRVGQTRDPPVAFREPGGLFTEDGGPSKSRSQRFGEPLAPA
jgi:hypothetical protein